MTTSVPKDPKIYPIVHLQADLNHVVQWANQKNKRWVFTDSNAGSNYFNDYCSLNELNKIDWNAVQAKSWQNCQEKKQAEFLIEDRLPWKLIESIGVFSGKQHSQAIRILSKVQSQPEVMVKRTWYY